MCKCKKTTELCAYYNQEVLILSRMIKQKCPNCGEHIAPCSICDMDVIDCRTDCPCDKTQFEDLDRDELMYLIGCYNNYILEYYDDHKRGMNPVSVYEFYENDFRGFCS